VIEPAAVIALALVAAAAATGARFRPGAWYASLRKPPWTPPDRVFAPVWTLLYVAMAVAAWWAWRHGRGPLLAAGAGLWVAQLAANAAWSWLFFGRRHIGAALAELGVLLGLVAATTAPLAGWLMVPYPARIIHEGGRRSRVGIRRFEKI